MNSPRVLTVNHADTGAGGAAAAGYRLHRWLVDAGVDATMVVGQKASRDDSVAQMRTLRTFRRPLRAALQSVGLNELDGIGSFSMSRRPDFLDADVVHYHAIHGDWFSYPAMGHLTNRKPSVITLHDMWPFTGHCSFSFGCRRWETGCGSCPHPEAFPRIKRDATALEWRIKDRVWAASRLTVVSPSRWLADEAAKSMLGQFDIHVIRHGIDTETFQPVNRSAARSALGLSTDQPVVLFGAAFAGDRRKGPDLFMEAIQTAQFKCPVPIRVALMGRWGRTLEPEIRAAGCEVTDFDYVASDRVKAALYSAADLLAFPSRADNSPLTVLESLACGTPVVAFDVGGVGELVQPGQNGMLVPAEDATAMGHAIADMLAAHDSRLRLGEQARQQVLTSYTIANTVKEHLDLYRAVLERGL